MRTNTLKVVTTEADDQAVLDGIIAALTKTPRENQSSSTVEFKPICFQDNGIGLDSITELIEERNSYVHETWAILVIDKAELGRTAH